MEADGKEDKQKPKKKAPSIHDKHRERMRKKYVEGGLEVLADHEALELLLFYSVKQGNVNPLAHRMLNEFGSITALFEADAETIARTCGISINTAVLISLILPLSKRYEMSKWDKNEVIDSSQKACDYAKSLFIGATDEIMFMICLDSKNKVIFPVEIARGTIDKAPIYPRVIMDKVLKYNAASIILSHNHPSGSVIPSQSDLKTTTFIVGILEKIEVKVADHIIVGGSNTLSFAEKSLLHFK